MKKIYVLLVLAFFAFTNIIAQTTIISPTGDGGFETGTTPVANGWTAVNSTTDAWVVGTAAGVGSGTNAAYVSQDAGVTFGYSQINTIQHLYRDFTAPAGTETVATLSFKWKAGGEGSPTQDWDNLKVFLVPTTVTPIANTANPVGNLLVGPGSNSGRYNLSFAAYNNETLTFPVTPGVSYRLIFSWKSDISDIVPPSAAIDDVSLTTRNAVNITSTSIGGLWNSPATWVGGVVPAGENATIADGAVVTINQVVAVNNLTIGGGTSGILQWNGTANALTVSKNLLVNPGANLNMFIAVGAHSGVTVNVGGNMTNNGTVHAAMAAGILSFNNSTSVTPSLLDGSGTFVGGIIGQLFNTSTGGLTINTAQNIVIRALVHTAGALNTNGKLSIDNTATIFGANFNNKIYSVVVTAMGSGYNSATPPTITIANPGAGGTVATATPVIDDVTGTLRSITITNAGNGYAVNPSVTISGGTGTGAIATAINNRYSSGLVTASTQKSGIATISGGLNIRSEQAVGAIASSTSLGVGYTSAPSVGFGLPFGYQNLVTNGGSGYTSAPTIAVSGGTSLTGVTNPTFTVVVAQGKVVSVIAASGGTFWTSPPTLTVTGGGGTGATAAYPTNSLATATATIANGAINGYTLTNPGFGYTAAPTVSLVGGGFTTAATAFSACALYNLTLNFFTPAPSNAAHTDMSVVPANGRINTLVVTNAVAGSGFSSNVEVYSSTALTFTTSLWNMGANTLTASHPAYAGFTGNATNNISGTISLSTPGGSLTRTFPYEAPFIVATGTGSLATGSTVTSLTASRTGAPSGTVNPSGTAVGSRAYRLVANSGAVYGTAPVVTMNYNATDNLSLVTDNPTLFIGQSAALAGPWDTRSLTSGTGSLTATGSRATATVTPGPIAPTGDDYFAWVTTYVPPTCAIPTAVATNTVTASSANVTWTSAAGSFIVEYGLQGFVPGTGATAGTGGTVITSTGSSQAITGLITNTSYDVYVRQDCTAATLGYSPNSLVTNFVTLIDCAALPTLSCNASVTTSNLATAGGLFSVDACGFTTPGREKIYSFTSTLAGTYTLNITNLNGGTGYNDYFFKVADGNCAVNTGWTCIDDLNVTGSTNFTLAAATTYYILVDAESAASTANHTFNIACPAACPAPTALATNTITSIGANVTWTGTGTYILEYGLTGFTPGTDNTAGVGGTLINPATSPQAITGLTASTGYTVYIRQDCTGASNGYSLNSTVAFTTLAPPPANDDATGAISLTVGAGCTTDPYSNVTATQSVGEPFPSCEGTAGFAGMWYSFVAPTSGAVKISCDGTGTLGDTRMALFSASNAADYTTFNIISCDDDNGVTNTVRSLFYAAGLTAGTTYYINVDLFGAGSARGTYCVTVDELTSSMISTTAGDCISDVGVAGLNTTYAGWSSMVDATGNLSANVRLTGGTATSVSCSKTIKTGAPRIVNTIPYMNRNFSINATGVTNADIQLFFTDAELTNLGSAIGDLQISRVPGTTCNADFTGLDGLLTQTSNGSVNGVSFIQATTPGFSNFYVRGAGGVLPVSIDYIKGTKQSNGNVIDWKIACTGIPEITMELQRSTDSRNFKGIYNETATAVRCLQAFTSTDNAPAAGINYYRIKTTEPDGKVKYSTIIALINKDKGFEIVSLAPNPARANATLSLATAKAGKVDIVITDVVGKLVSKQQNTLVSGNNTINMNFEQLAGGTYNIVVTNADGEVKTTRFVKY
jgi:Secretion system C-terminal sorting domain